MVNELCWYQVKWLRLQQYLVRYSEVIMRTKKNGGEVAAELSPALITSSLNSASVTCEKGHLLYFCGVLEGGAATFEAKSITRNCIIQCGFW